MAGMPVFRLAGTPVANTTVNEIAWPSHATNDIGLLLIQTEAQTTTLVTAAGFTEVTSATTGTAGATNAVALQVFWSRAVNASMANVTINDAGDHTYAVIVTFTNCATTGNPWNAVTANVVAVGATTIAVTGLTTTAANCLVVDVIAETVDAATAWVSAWTNASLANPSITQGFNGATSTSGGGGLGMAYGGQVTAGAIATTTCVGRATSKIAYVRIALAPIDTSVTGTVAMAVPQPSMAATGLRGLLGTALIALSGLTMSASGTVPPPGITGTATVAVPQPDLSARAPVFDEVRQAIIDGLANTVGTEWNAEKVNIPVTAVVRTSDTVITITLPALSGFNISTTETVQAVIPALALTGGLAVTATPTFDIKVAITGTVAMAVAKPSIDVDAYCSPLIFTLRETGTATATVAATTDSVTLTAGSVFYAVIVNVDDAHEFPAAASISGWTQVATHAVSWQGLRITMLRKVGDGSSGTLTISFNAETQDDIAWDVTEVVGADTATPEVAGKSKTNSGTSGYTASVTFDPVARAYNAHLVGMLAFYNVSITPEEGWTELWEQEDANINHSTIYRVGGTDLTASWSKSANTGWIVCGIEIAAEPNNTGTVAIAVPQPDLSAEGTTTEAGITGTASLAVPQPGLAANGQAAFFFGLQTSDGTDDVGGVAAIFGANRQYGKYTCPGSGAQVVQQLTLKCYQASAVNLRLAIYDLNLQLVAEGTTEVAVVGAAFVWQGHQTQVTVKAAGANSPAILQGGTDYIFAIACDANGLQIAITDRDPTLVWQYDVAMPDYTGGFPATLEAKTNSTWEYTVRCGVYAASAVGVIAGSGAVAVPQPSMAATGTVSTGTTGTVAMAVAKPTLAASGWRSKAYRIDNNKDANVTGSTTISPTTAVAIGDLITLHARIGDGYLSAVSDDQGNVWFLAKRDQQLSGGIDSVETWFAVAQTAATPVVSLTNSGSGTLRAWLDTYRGFTNYAFDQATSAHATTLYPTVGPLTPSKDDAILIAVVGIGGSRDCAFDDPFADQGSVAQKLHYADRLIAVTGSLTATSVLSNPATADEWVALLVSFVEGSTARVSLAVAKPTLAALGTVGTGITGTASMAVAKPTLAATGKQTQSGTASLAVPSPAFSVSGTTTAGVTGTGTLAVPQPDLSATATQTQSGTATLVVPQPDLTAAGSQTSTGTATLVVPQPDLSATGSTSGAPGTALLTVPTPTLAAQGTRTQNVTGTATLSVSPSLAASGKLTHVATAALVVPQPDLTAYGTGGGIGGTAELAVPQPDLTAAGQQTQSGTATLAVAPPTLAATGTTTPRVTGTAAMAVARPTLAAQGTITAKGTASMAVAPAMAVAGFQTQSGTATLTVPQPGLSATGMAGLGIIGYATLAVPQPDLTAAGTRTQNVTGTVSVAVVQPTITATGIRGNRGTATLAVAPTLAATGQQTSKGTASLAVAKPTLAAQGTMQNTGTVSMAVARPTLVALGNIGAEGTATLAVQPAFSGTGTHQQHVIGTGAVAVVPAVYAVGNRQTIVVLTGKYAPEHAGARTDISAVQGFAAEHAAALTDIGEAGSG